MASGPTAILHGVPYANRAMKVEAYSGGVVVTVPMKRPGWTRLVKWLVPLSQERRVELDAVGTWVLQLCDGRRTVEDVIEQVGEKYHLSFQEARVAVLQFMRMLVDRGIVAVILPEDRAAK
jgi:hypothetical protein